MGSNKFLKGLFGLDFDCSISYPRGISIVFIPLWFALLVERYIRRDSLKSWDFEFLSLKKPHPEFRVGLRIF